LAARPEKIWYIVDWKYDVYLFGKLRIPLFHTENSMGKEVEFCKKWNIKFPL
jgi:hypothetical protein